MKKRAAKREVYVANAAAAPTLVNFLQRAGATVKDAPEDYAAQIKSGRLQSAVIVVPAQFEARLALGRDDPAAGDVRRNRDQGAAGDTCRTDDRARLFARAWACSGCSHAASARRCWRRSKSMRSIWHSQARGAQLLFLVPWLALLGSVAGAISVAIDVTAGERERGSLEPLLMNPVAAGAVVLGKWAVVALCSAAVVVSDADRFHDSNAIHTQREPVGADAVRIQRVRLVHRDAAAVFRDDRALNMLAATYGRSHKEAQTYATYLAMLVNFTPIVPLFISIRDAAWQLFVPAMAQQAVMMRALRGETISAIDILVPGSMALAIAAVALAAQARLLRNERIIFSR